MVVASMEGRCDIFSLFVCMFMTFLLCVHKNSSFSVSKSL